MLASPTAEITIRRELRNGDALAIVDLHRRVYCAEYGRNEQFVMAVAESLAGKIAQGLAPPPAGRCGCSSARTGSSGRSD